jgi:polyphenol oxidase
MTEKTPDPFSSSCENTVAAASDDLLARVAQSVRKEFSMPSNAEPASLAKYRNGTRRDFLRRTTFVASGLSMFRLLGQKGRADEPDNCAPPKPAADPVPFTPDVKLAVRTRKSVAALDATEIDRLKRAYDALRNLTKGDPVDPRGWLQQANVHCWYCGGGPDMAAGEEIHNGWWFFPWHRCYLFFHERILAKLISDATFALPYWDWDSANNRALPDPYATPNDETNSLFDPLRGAKAGDFISDSFVGSVVMNKVMNASDYRLYMGTDVDLSDGHGGRLEIGPHGIVHVWAGDPKSLNASPDMGVLATAAQDPLFFAHHANIDRLWDVWLRSASFHTNPSDPKWLTHRWTFYDENKRWTSISVADVLDHEGRLRYAYSGVTSSPPQTFAVMAPMKTELTQEPLTKTAKLPKELRTMAEEPAATLPRVFVLHIDGIEASANKSAVVRVFANLPSASSKSSIESKTYVGYFTLLAKASKEHEHAKGHRPMNVALEIPPAIVDQLKAASDLSVTLVPLAGAQEKPGKMSVSFDKLYITADR